MAIFDGLEIFLEDASSQEAILEFHTEDSHDSTTVRSVTRCVEVTNGQQCSFKIRTLPDFQWHDGDCLRLMLDFDDGETVNRYELYLLRDLPRTRQLTIKEPVLRRTGSDNQHEATINHLYIRSDIPDKYCQKGRLVFRNLRQDNVRPGGRKTIAQVKKDQGRIRMEVTRLQVEELFEADEILLLRPPKRGRTHKDLLEKRGIYIETRVELDDHYERLPKRKFITRNLEELEGRKQLNFVFEYRKEGVFDPYSPSSSEADDSSLLPDKSEFTPKDVYSVETQPSIRARDEQLPRQSVSPTHSQRDTIEVEVDSEATTDREETQDIMVAKTGLRVEFHDMRAQQPSPAPSKREHEECTHPTIDSPSGEGLTGLGDKQYQPAREDYSSHGFNSCDPTRCQTLIARIREAVSLIDTEQQGIEEDDEFHEQLLASLKETELEYRQTRYLQRLEQKRERQALIARVEGLTQGIEEEKRLFEAERVKFQVLLERQEQALLELRKSKNASALLQTNLGEVSAAGPPRKRRRKD